MKNLKYLKIRKTLKNNDLIITGINVSNSKFNYVN